MVSFSDLKFISPTTLRGWLRSGSPSKGGLVVVDVRDVDYVGGHIKGCWHYPANEIQSKFGDLQSELSKRKISDVVFHCALSQQRGPSSALKFMRYIEDTKQLGDLHVYVLEGGFTKWQQSYGEDSEVTEAYDKGIWQWS